MNSSYNDDFSNSIKNFFKKWPKFYYFIFDFFGPVYFGGIGPKKFLRKYNVQDKIINVGSGPRRLDSSIINIDIIKFPGVDIVADITKISFEDESVGGIICDQVLEHLEDPHKVISEMYRVLKSGGYAYISTPFMYPFHSSPSDYTRWTKEGLVKMFRDFELIDAGVRSGLFSTLTVNLTYLFASIFSFGFVKIYWVSFYFFMLIFSPIKFLDIIGNRLPFAVYSASILYCVIKKK